MPWTAADSQDSPAGVPSLVLADLLELGKDELGRALFFKSLRLGPGASAFREFVLNGLCFIDGEKMMMEDAADDPKGFAKLQHVHDVTAQLIKDANEKTRARDNFLVEGYEKVLTSAQMSVAKVKAMADRLEDKAKAEAQKQKADMWLSKEVAALDKRKADLSLAATKAASFAAGKVHALISHLRSMGLLSHHFVEHMELWSQLDSTDAKARSVRKELKTKEVDEVAPVVLFAAEKTAAISAPASHPDSALESVPEHELQGPQESLRDSAPDHKLQGSGLQKSVRDSAPDRELQGSGSQEMVRDSVPDRELQGSGSQVSVRDSAPDDELQGSGSQESLRDSAPDRELQGSGPQESLRDSAPDRELQGSGPQESLRDSVPDHDLQGSGSQEMVRDSVPDHELQGSGSQEMVRDSVPDHELQGLAVPILRADTRGSMADSEIQLRYELEVLGRGKPPVLSMPAIPDPIQETLRDSAPGLLRGSGTQESLTSIGQESLPGSASLLLRGSDTQESFDSLDATQVPGEPKLVIDCDELDDDELVLQLAMLLQTKQEPGLDASAHAKDENAGQKPPLQLLQADADPEDEEDEEARQEDLAKRARRSDVPTEILQKAKIAQRSVQGGQCYKRFKDLLAEHGKENAERLRAEKKAKQSALGDAYENDYELFLVFDEAKVSSTATHRSATPALRVDPTSRGLQPGQSRESLNGNDREGKNPNGRNPPNPKSKKPANYTGKANSKLKMGRSALTDAKFWVKQIEADQAVPEPALRKMSSQLSEGYISQIQLYRKPMEDATETLDWKVISGAKDAATLEPLVKALDKAIEDYNNALKPIKGLFELTYASAQRVAHAAVEAERGMLPIGIHGDDFRYTEHGQKLVLVSMNLLIDNKMQDAMNARLSIAHSEFMGWYWLNEFFNRMEKHGRFLTAAAKAELEEACAFQEAVYMATMDGTVVAYKFEFE
ncbi:unnamed protein product [Symbiodinium sp. CCMP2592]|nr:unnamed protein product [Symbiodinium sp. CCMP2592]